MSWLKNASSSRTVIRSPCRSWPEAATFSWAHHMRSSQQLQNMDSRYIEAFWAPIKRPSIGIAPVRQANLPHFIAERDQPSNIRPFPPRVTPSWFAPRHNTATAPWITLLFFSNFAFSEDAPCSAGLTRAFSL
jgi:hypothetical protein